MTIASWQRAGDGVNNHCSCCAVLLKVCDWYLCTRHSCLCLIKSHHGVYCISVFKVAVPVFEYLLQSQNFARSLEFISLLQFPN